MAFLPVVRLAFHSLVFTTMLSVASAATTFSSYVMFQADFNGDSIAEIQKFRVEYSSDAQSASGLSLLRAVFGTPVQQIILVEGVPTPIDRYVAGNSTLGASFLYGGGYLEGVTFGSTVIENYGDSDVGILPQSWFNYCSLGSYSSTYYDPFLGEFVTVNGAYSAGAWTGALTSYADKKLVDGSFDAFVFSDYSTEDYEADAVPSIGPNAGNFAGLNTFFSSWTDGSGNVFTVYAAPEPARGMLALFGAAFIVLRRRRNRH